MLRRAGLPGSPAGVTLAPMIVAADNLTAARPSVRRLIDGADAAGLAALCRAMESAGARWLDLNPGYLPPARREAVWRLLIETAEAACDLTLVLDAPEPASLALAAGMCTRPAVLNMATAAPERLGPVLDIAAGTGMAVIAATMTALVPVSAEERLSLAALIVEEASRRGIAGERLILDPMVMPLALPDGEAHARGVIDFLRALPGLFEPRPLTLAALSNLTTDTAGARARFAAAPFLAAAWGAGLDVALADALDPAVMQTARLCRVFAGERVFAPAEYAG